MRILVTLVPVVWLGCAAAQAPTPAASPSSTPEAPKEERAAGKSTPVDEAASESSTPKLPTTCADPNAVVCTPPGAFVERLCAKPHQDAALALFSQSTPFTRAYLRGRLDELSADEEVVGNGGGTYDLLRWDGTCSTGIEAEGVTRTRPPRPRAARVQWHRIATPVQDALVAASDAVKRARSKRGKECKGAMSGDVSAACEKADDALAAAVVEYVRSSAALSAIDDLP